MTSSREHCGRPSCRCTHTMCDGGYMHPEPRMAPYMGPAEKPGDPAWRPPKHVTYDRVTPCATCKPDAYEAAAMATSRADFMRRLQGTREVYET